jgi:hypothetical protein
LATTSSKMGRLATAMATAMVTTMWMGTMSAPWIHDGRMEGMLACYNFSIACSLPVSHTHTLSLLFRTM